MRFLAGPILVAVATLGAVFWWGGPQALLLAALLSVLEVTLSFDNAVINAKVLRDMDARWQQRFLTWGILLAVVGTRLVLPILIVSIAAVASPYMVAVLAATNPEAYSRLLQDSHGLIGAFGGAFLMMVSLKYFFDHSKDVHWINHLESRFASWGRIEAIEIAFALLVLMAVSILSGGEGHIIEAGIVGIVLFVAMEGITSSLSAASSAVVRSSAALFVYLNILDAAFSLDGVVAAFALTSSLPIIVAGLGIGAYFVRSLTLFLVRNKTLETLVYLEHGAHWAILGLALSMLAGLVVHIPEIVIGSIGLIFVGLSYYSSRKEAARASVAR